MVDAQAAPVRSRSSPRLSPAACEACRKQKMRCTRHLDTSENQDQPCDRCRRNGRPCHIPARRPQGRKPGAVGRYTGVEKAVRQIQNQVRKASRTSLRSKGAHKSPSESDILEVLLNFRCASPKYGDRPGSSPRAPASDRAVALATPQAHASNFAASPHREDDSVSNPLALLANASGEAQANETSSFLGPSQLTDDQPVPEVSDIAPLMEHGSGAGQSLGTARNLLRRPGYVSLGLKMDRTVLEGALENLFTRPGCAGRYANYFKTREQEHAPDTGPDVDPVDLGLISPEEVQYLFPLFFDRLHPINGILDPALHTPDYVRPRSALLFTWILAITAQFDHASGALAKRLRLHGEKLSKHVHGNCYKSVEIAQGYYISLLAAVPANTLSEDRSWLYTTYALGMIADLGLDRPNNGAYGLGNGHMTLSPFSCPEQLPHSCNMEQPMHSPTGAGLAPGYEAKKPNRVCPVRLARNRERTWFRVLLWERAHSAASGRVTPFPENDLTRRVHDWWRHPLADPTDKYTSAFVILRRHLSSLYYQVKERFGHAENPRHWVKALVDSTLDPWRQEWITNVSPEAPITDRMRNLFLNYVYMHGRLWTLSFALYDPSNTAQDATDTKSDCFEAAVNCCEMTIRDLRDVGEPMYCMLAPTWTMSSYAAVLSLKLFPQLYGDRPGQQVELLALLAEVALQLERAGTTPRHRFGLSALLGQHLFVVLRRRLIALKSEAAVMVSPDPLSALPCLDIASYQTPMTGQQFAEQTQPLEYPIYLADPFWSSGLSPRGAGAAQEAFADIMREWGGLPFDGGF